MQYFLVALLCLPMFAVSADEPVSLQADISIGSTIGKDDIYGTNLPFWGEIRLNKRWHSGFNVFAGVGHRSNADTNGIEYDFEFAKIGATFNAGPFYIEGALGKALRGDEAKGDGLGWAEAGFKQGAVRFGVIHRDTEGGGYDVTALKLGYTFDLTGG